MIKKSMISILAATAILAACSKDNEKNPGGTNGDATYIQLSAGMPSATITPDSKAPVTGSMTFTPAIAGWEAAVGEVDYTTAPTWNTEADISANAQNEAVTLDEPQVYNPDDDMKTYMQAWYPQGTLNAGIVTFANADGTNDAMLAAPIYGSKWDNTGKELVFTHATTQIKFVVKAGTSLTDAVNIRSITIHDAQVPTGFNLATPEVTYAAAADLAVPNLTEAAIGTEAAAGDAVMIKPMTGNTLTLDIVTSATTHENVVATIDGDTDFQAGKAYTITLTFEQEAVNLTATVTEWTAGTGSAIIK